MSMLMLLMPVRMTMPMWKWRTIPSVRSLNLRTFCNYHLTWSAGERVIVKWVYEERNPAETPSNHSKKAKKEQSHREDHYTAHSFFHCGQTMEVTELTCGFVGLLRCSCFYCLCNRSLDIVLHDDDLWLCLLHDDDWWRCLLHDDDLWLCWLQILYRILDWG